MAAVCYFIKRLRDVAVALAKNRPLVPGHRVVERFQSRAGAVHGGKRDHPVYVRRQDLDENGVDRDEGQPGGHPHRRAVAHDPPNAAQIKSEIQDAALFVSIVPIQSASVSRTSFMTSLSFRPERTST
jgi:hypothetical protein